VEIMSAMLNCLGSAGAYCLVIAPPPTQPNPLE